VTTTVPFQYPMHLLTIPVCVGDAETRFIFDTGIGVNSLARALGAAPSGSVFTGRRMSGQEVTAPMTCTPTGPSVTANEPAAGHDHEGFFLANGNAPI
jgi:hypothetical protein